MKLIYFSWIFLIVASSFIVYKAIKMQIISGDEALQRSRQNRFRINAIFPERGKIITNDGKALAESKDAFRFYTDSEAFAHVVGYVQTADTSDLTTYGLDLGEKVGKTGLEKQYESILHGQVGGEVVEYSATGEKLRVLSKTPVVSGRDIHLSLDSRLQDFAYKLLKKSNYKGSVIISTPNGHLLSLVSSPSFDSNVLSQATDSAKLEQIFTDKNQPMFFRAIAGLYPPASTFKLVVGTAALEENIIDSSFQIDDKGFIQNGKFRYGNWYFDEYGKVEGLVNIVKAIQRSNDTFFYQVGEKLGIDKMAFWAKKFGFGSEVNIDIPGSSAGLVPDPEWKEKYRGEDWYLGDTYITAIGQGNLQTTPLQVHQMMSVFADRGKLCQSKLLLSNEKDVNINPDCKNLEISKENQKLIVQGLQKTCESGGTAWPLFGFKVDNKNLPINESFQTVASASANFRHIPIACKTGTGETGKSKEVNGKIKHLNHAWLTAFAPVDNPQIVVTVMLENAGEGSTEAGPLIKEILREYFEKIYVN